MSACVKAWTENFLDPANIAAETPSSEQAAYPSSNLYDGKRFKPWRSNGYWLIESGSNTIIFREAVGVDLTATIAAGEYTSSTAFFAAVKTALEAVGVSTYTVSFDTTTGKVKILSALSGGATVFQLRWTDVGSADMAGILGFDTATNDTGAASYIADDMRIHTEEFLLWDLGIPSNPKAFAAIGQRNRPLKISPNASIRLQGNSTSNFSTAEFDQAVPYFDNVLALENEDGLHTSGLRYWRLVIVDQSNSNGYVELGEIFLGDYEDLERGNVVRPFSNSLIDLSDVMVSEGGQVYAAKNNATQRFQLQWQGLKKIDLEILERVFNAFGLNKPFFVSFDRAEVFSTDGETWVRYCRFDTDMEFQLISFNNFSASWNLREEL